MNKKDYKIYDGKNIVWNDAAIHGKEVAECGITAGLVAKAIKDFRKKYNFTQVDLANRLGVSQVMVSKLERGDYNPTLNQLLKISYKLTRSNVMFFDILNSITKTLKKDHIYIFDDEEKISIKQKTTSRTVKSSQKKKTKKQKAIA